MGMRSTTQAFQFDVPFEQLFQLAGFDEFRDIVVGKKTAASGLHPLSNLEGNRLALRILALRLCSGCGNQILKHGRDGNSESWRQHSTIKYY